VIVAAGYPGLSLKAAGFGLFWNALLSVPLVLSMGFLGPALGTGLAFVLQVATYIVFIGLATRVPVTRIFPLAAYLRVFATAAVAGLAGWGVKRALSLPALPLLLLEVGTVLGVYTLLGLVTGLLSRADLAFLTSTLRRKKAA
jgi:hypothetical protein